MDTEEDEDTEKSCAAHMWQSYSNERNWFYEFGRTAQEMRIVHWVW
jgi:hypothetical protein